MLSARSVVKKYGENTVLRGVSLDVHAGEVLGLIGANGAGKSTLVGIIGGSVTLSSGSVSIPDASASGPAVETVHQDVDAALVPELSIAENLVLPRLAAGELGHAPSGRRIRESARHIAAGRLDDLDLDAPVSSLGTSAKQRVLIARALSRRPSVLILDEPTAALSVTEQRELRASVRELAASGTAVVFITHHLGEIAAVCDRVVALRDGQVSAEFAAPFDAQQLAFAILGELARHARAEEAEPTAVPGATVLELRGVRAFAHAAPIDLAVRRGEIVGITGLLGAGKTELLQQLVGAAPRHGGRVLVDGREYVPRHPRDAIRAGFGFVPENRVTEAEIPEWTIAESITLPDLLRYRRGGLLSVRAEREAAASVIERLGIVASGPRAAIETLSGGNRQKVVVGRWLAARSRVLVLDEPFRGVDIGARGDIARLLRAGHAAGDVDAVIVASSDPEEILEVADRILVMSDGAIVGEVTPAEVDAETLSELMTRGAAAAEAAANAANATGERTAEPAAESAPEPAGRPAATRKTPAA